jgi:dihydroxy-acid dehydratase
MHEIRLPTFLGDRELTLHLVLEMQVGGPIGLVQDGDIITVDVEKRKINVELTEAELANRRENWRAPPLKASRGTLYKV